MDDTASLQKLLHTIVKELCSDWVFSCDGGCQWDVAQRKVLKEGPWTFLQQPKKGMPEQENSDIAFMITHSNYKVYTQEFFETVFEPVMKRINDEFMRDFEKVPKDGRWLMPIQDISVQEVLQFKPWSLSDDKKRIRTVYELRGGDHDMDCNTYRFELESFHGSTSEQDPALFKQEIGRTYSHEELCAM